MAAPGAATSISSTSSPPPSWSGLLPELLCEILTHLSPADVACFRAVCRAWHSAARQHWFPQHPWIVLPNGSFGTLNGDFFHQIPGGGLPENVTCLGAAGSWLVLDRTDDIFRRTDRWDTYRRSRKFPERRHDVKHKHSYLLYSPFSGKTYSPFSGKTVPLPELDSVVGHVPETFEIRKVLMRDDDDLLVVVTNSRYCTVIICRPGKGRFVLPFLDVWDVAFFGSALYGITRDEDLVVFDLANNNDGEPIVPGFKRVIAHPLADGDDDEDLLSWMDDYQSINADEYDGNKTTTDDDDKMMADDGSLIVTDEEVPYEPKDYITTTRCLVLSCGGHELLMVRHQLQSPPFHSPAYTRKLDIFKLKADEGQWIPATDTALAQGEALFLSQSSSRITHAFGDIEEGFVYFIDRDDAFDTRSGTRRLVTLPWQRGMADGRFLTWYFAPGLVV